MTNLIGSQIQNNGTSQVANNAIINVDMSSSIITYEMSTLLTCDPAPAYNGEIVDASGGAAFMAPVMLVSLSNEI